jgi:ABC-type Na+ transport system ATPase subunit NatA
VKTKERSIPRRSHHPSESATLGEADSLAKRHMNVNVEIFIKALNGGFSYKAVAMDENGHRYAVEGWASGTEKEVKRLVQRRLDEQIKLAKIKEAKEAEKIKAQEADFDVAAAILNSPTVVTFDAPSEALPNKNTATTQPNIRIHYKKKEKK